MPIGTAVTTNLSLKQALANTDLAYGPINNLTAGGPAAVTTQAGATALRSGVNDVIISGAAGRSCILPSITSSEAGNLVIVINDGANAINVYPSLSELMNGSANAAQSIAAAGFGIFIMKPQDPSVPGTPPGWSGAAFT